MSSKHQSSPSSANASQLPVLTSRYSNSQSTISAPFSFGVGHDRRTPPSSAVVTTRDGRSGGVAPRGVDFGAPDGLPATVVCLLLTPWPDPDAVQLALVADVARAFREDDVTDAVLTAASTTEVVAALRAAASH